MAAPTFRVRGLHNLGQTCYFNALLHCLAAVPAFTAFVRRLRARLKSQNTLNASREVEITSALTRVLLDLQPLEDGERAAAVHSTKAVFRAIETVVSKAATQTQQDSEESFQLLVHLLMEAKCLTLMDSQSQHHSFSVILSDGGAASSITSRGLRLLELPCPSFRLPCEGRICERISCQTCGHGRQTIRPFQDLVLPCPQSGTIEGALREFTRNEIVESTCSRCSGFDSDRESGSSVSSVQRKKVKSISIATAPEMLVLALQRLVFTEQGLARLTDFVRFKDTLDITPSIGVPCQHSGPSSSPAPLKSGCLKCQLRPSGSSVRYRLAAVLEHLGGSTSGHYICWRRAPTCRLGRDADSELQPVNFGNQWLCISDSSWRQASWEEVRERGSSMYMLFYSRDR